MANEMIKGTVRFQEIEGGFWGIIGEDGQKYRPVKGIPPIFQKEGLAVSVEIAPFEGFSIFMWGKDVNLLNIRAGNS
jgi:hypothetical protein